jgi:hypothetical protein
MEAILTFLRKHCPRLSHLDLSEWEDADDRLLRDAFSRSSSSSVSRLKTEEAEEDGRGEISYGFAMLQKLSLASTSVTDRGVAFLPTSLTSLDMSNLGKAFTDSGLKRLTQRCTRLMTLNVAYTSVTNSGLQCLSDDLHHLDVSFTNVCINFRKPGYCFSKPVPLPLPRNIRVLNLFDLKGYQAAALTRPLMAALCSCQHLRTLHLGTQSSLNWPYTHAWMKMKALRELALRQIHISDAQTLWFLPDGLRSLSMSGIVSTFYPEHIQRLPSSLTSLDISPRYVYATKPWLVKLKRTLPELKWLRVVGCTNYDGERLKLIEMGVDFSADSMWRPGPLNLAEGEDEPSCPRELDERWREELEHPSLRRLEDKLEGIEYEEEGEEALVPVDKIDVAPDELDDEEEAEDDEDTMLAVGW